MNIETMQTRDLVALRNEIDSILPHKRREAIADMRATMRAMAKAQGFTLQEVLQTKTRPASRATD